MASHAGHLVERRGLELAAGGLATLTVGAVGLGAVAGPADGESGPTVCPFRLATGAPCPFCGMTHAVVALGGGDLGAMVEANPAAPAMVALALVLLVRLATAFRRGTAIAWPRLTMLAVATTVAGSWIVRLSGGL